jgi:hypothetical protein
VEEATMIVNPRNNTQAPCFCGIMTYFRWLDGERIIAACSRAHAVALARSSAVSLIAWETRIINVMASTDEYGRLHSRRHQAGPE